MKEMVQTMVKDMIREARHIITASETTATVPTTATTSAATRDAAETAESTRPAAAPDYGDLIVKVGQTACLIQRLNGGASGIPHDELDDAKKAGSARKKTTISNYHCQTFGEYSGGDGLTFVGAGVPLGLFISLPVLSPERITDGFERVIHEVVAETVEELMSSRVDGIVKMHVDDAGHTPDHGLAYIGAGPTDPRDVSVDAVTLNLLAAYETVVVRHTEHPGLTKEDNKVERARWLSASQAIRM
jgi:hypothetical protein